MGICGITGRNFVSQSLKQKEKQLIEIITEIIEGNKTNTSKLKELKRVITEYKNES